MPGRGGSLINGQWQDSGPAILTNFSVDDRTGNQPSEYIALESIEFLDGFESGLNDEFVAYITTSGNGEGYEGVEGLYRYGFNGKENDNETGTQDYGFRIYNPSLGKFLSVDPLTKNFVWNSPFAFAENSPLKYIDLDGAEKFDPASKPTGITHFELATVPMHPADASSDYHINAGKYQLYPVSDPSGVRHAYWVARYTYTEGPYAGYSRNDWIVGTDGVVEFVKNSDKYYNRAGWIDYAGGANQTFSLNSILKGYKRVISNPYNWVGGANILIVSYGKYFRNAPKHIADDAAVNSFSPLKFSQQAADDLVIRLRKEYGGNVTVMKDGVDIFRVHQPGKHNFDGTSVTHIRVHDTPNGPKRIADSKAVPFDEQSFEILQKAANNLDGYSLRTLSGVQKK